MVQYKGFPSTNVRKPAEALDNMTQIYIALGEAVIGVGAGGGTVPPKTFQREILGD